MKKKKEDIGQKKRISVKEKRYWLRKKEDIGQEKEDNGQEKKGY